jgi:hypothetical protein
MKSKYALVAAILVFGNVLTTSAVAEQVSRAKLDVSDAALVRTLPGFRNGYCQRERRSLALRGGWKGPAGWPAGQKRGGRFIR